MYIVQHKHLPGQTTPGSGLLTFVSYFDAIKLLMCDLSKFVVNRSTWNTVNSYFRGIKETEPPTMSDGEEEYEVEKIVAKRIRKGKVEYHVKWKGWDMDDVSTS